MTEPWMNHPKLVAWFDDLEDAVSTALMLDDTERREVKALRAPRADTWVVLARDTDRRDRLRARLSALQQAAQVPLAKDCHILESQEEFVFDEDSFDADHGLSAMDVDFVEEGSEEDVRRELLSDAEDYAASEEDGWFYSAMDDDVEPVANPDSEPDRNF